MILYLIVWIISACIVYPTIRKDIEDKGLCLCIATIMTLAWPIIMPVWIFTMWWEKYYGRNADR